MFLSEYICKILCLCRNLFGKSFAVLLIWKYHFSAVFQRNLSFTGCSGMLHSPLCYITLHFLCSHFISHNFHSMAHNLFSLLFSYECWLYLSTFQTIATEILYLPFGTIWILIWLTMSPPPHSIVLENVNAYLVLLKVLLKQKFKTKFL